MKRILASVLCVLLLLSSLPVVLADGAGSSATIDFTDKANRVSYSSEKQVWAQNGIVVTNDKGASTSNVGDYGGEGYPVRFYKSSTVTVEYIGMTQIVFNCDDYKASYATDLETSIKDATVSVSGTVVTVTLPAPADSFVIAELAAQVRVDSITVYGEGGVTPPVKPDEPDEPVVPADSAVLDLTDKANRTSYSSSQQVWKQNGIVVTNDKGASTTNVGDYGNPGRFYKNSTVTIAYPGMTKIVIDSVTYSDNDYAIGWTNSFSADATATVVDGDVTIVLAAPADVFVWEQLTSQSRAYTITVYTGEAGDTPVVPPVDPSDDPEADTELSIADAIALGASKPHDTYTKGKYYVTGVIAEVYNAQYGNMKLIDDAGNILTVYGTWSEDGTVRYDALDVKPVAGDTVTIYGVIGQYKDAPQMKNGWIVGFEGGQTPDVPNPPADDLGVVANPVTGVAYKFGMVQENVSFSDVYYLVGGMSGFYMATGTSADAALDVYLEETNGGYYLYAMVNGVKQYINMVVSEDGKHVNGAYESKASTVYTYDADYKTVIAEVDGAYYWFGTRNDKNYTTVGPCNVEYAGFYCQFYGAEGGDNPVDPDPDVPVDPPVSDEIEIDYPFLFGMTQYNVSEEDVYFLAGGMNGFYMETTTNPDEAIVVYVEAANGGYYFYTYDGDTKLYINMVVSADGKHVNGAYEAKASTVYRYDADYGTLIADVDGADYWFGTRNDKQYTTVGPVKVEYEGFYCEFYYFEDDPGDDPGDEPIEYDGTVEVSTVEGAAGETVNVTVTLPNNPGIISAKVKVFFDSSVLKFVGYEAGNFSAGGYSWSDSAIANENGYFIINWCDAINGDSTADLLATLTFEILEGAAEGFTAITLEYSCEDDMFNAADEIIYLEAVNGGVQIVAKADVLLGDVDGSGKVNNRDLGMLQRFVNEYEVALDEAAADMDGNGKVNNRDLGLLQKLVNSQ